MTIDKYHHSHQNVADKLVREYEGPTPFALYLKTYFAANKKHGSKDRRNISAICYEYFRKLSAEFPLKNLISPAIDIPKFIEAHLQQPLLFIRARPGKKELVKASLEKAGLFFESINEMSFALPNTSSLHNILVLNKDAVIQDFNSQSLANLLQLIPVTEKPLVAWDACSASGGKSILIKDFIPNVQLHVSDIRENILFNCEKRLKEAGIQPASLQVVDITLPFDIKRQFDFIFADLPCSGSGTWGRTPENLMGFTENQLDSFKTLQAKILHHLTPALKLGGYLLAATCSVYKNENEAQIEKLLATNKFKLIAQEYFIGYDKQADTLFGALMQKIAH
jgi:16S rRNA (cytosine967-C5)-methyltransferase